MNSFAYKEELYADLPAAAGEEHDTVLHSVHVGSRVTAAPDVEGPDFVVINNRPIHENTLSSVVPQEAPKKKYAKEAWPGKKHGTSLLM